MAIIGSNIRGRINVFDFSSGHSLETASLSTTNNNTDPKPWFNGRFLWVAGLNTTNNLYQYDLRSLSPTTFIRTFSLGHSAKGIYGDGRCLWDIQSTGVVTPWDLNTELSGTTITLPASTYRGLTGDGRDFWAHDVTNTNIIQFNEQGDIKGVFTAPSNTYDLHHDGRFLYIVTGLSTGNATIRQYDPRTGTELGSQNYATFGFAGEHASGICGDGRFLYVTWVDNILG